MSEIQKDVQKVVQKIRTQEAQPDYRTLVHRNLNCGIDIKRKK